MAPVVCNDPPVVDVPATCPVGTTFMAPLGGACGGSCNGTTGMCEYAMVEIACPPRGGNALPVTYAWQAKIREYLATLTAADFTPDPSASITYSPSGPEHDAPARDQIAWWVASGALSGSYYSVPYIGMPGPFDVQPSEFTLAQIEQDAPGYHAQVGWRGVATDYAAWLTSWDFPGNGYRNSKAEFLRAFSFTASDLVITTDRYVRQTYADVFIFPPLPYHGYVGRVAHSANFLGSSELEQCALAAYDVGTRSLLERTAELAPRWDHDPNGDIVAMGLRGLVYMSQSLGDADAIATAHTAAADLIEGNAAPGGGYWDHFNCSGCYDAQYEGTTMVAIREAAIASGWEEIRTNVVNLFRTISLLTLPEPSGHWVGPSHFSPATSAPPPSATGDTPSVLMANAAFGDDGLFWLTQSRHANVMNWPDLATMQTQLAGRFSGVRGTDANSFETQWSYDGHYSYGLPTFTNHKPEWYDTLRAMLDDPSDERRLPPFARSANFSEAIADDFVSVKMGDVGVIVHTGAVSNGGNPNGFGGGELSAFWTRDMGSAILGWSRGGQNPHPNTWTGAGAGEGWRRFAAHAVTGVVDGHAFSSARLSSVTRSHTLGDASATISVSGDLNTAQADPDDTLHAALMYQRSFEIGGVSAPDGVQVTTTLGALPSGVSELYEILPIWDHVYEQLPDGSGTDCVGEAFANHSMVTVAFMQGATSVVPPDGEGEVTNVTSVVITRFGHSAVIEFDSPRTVALGVSSCTDYQWSPVTRNLFVRLPTTAGTSPSISYTVHAGS